VYVDPDGREVSITPNGTFVVTYPDGTVRAFSADRYAQNPAAVDAAILDSVAGDEVAAKHDFQVGVLRWQYQQEKGTAPGDDEYIYQHYDETGPVYAITGSGEIHSASGDIEPDYSVETLAVILTTGGFAASAARAGGGTLTQTSKVFVTNIADDLAGEVLGVNPSLVKGVGKLAIDRLGNSASGVGLGKSAISQAEANVLTGPNRGLILVQENLGKPKTEAMQAARDFESGTAGALSDVASHSRAVPSLRFDNPNPGGRNYVRFDSARNLGDGTIELIDAKTRIVPFDTRSGPFVSDNVRNSLLARSRAIAQNPRFRGVLEFPDVASAREAKVVLRQLGITNLRVRVR
jgi:hypothetical protein